MNSEILSFCRNYMRVQPTLPIRYSQMQVLALLCSLAGPHTPVSISEKLGVSRPMVAAHLAALQAAGYVVRVASPDDGRSVYVLPTKSGKKLYLEYENANKRQVSILSQKMGAKKFEALVKLISAANVFLADD